MGRRESRRDREWQRRLSEQLDALPTYTGDDTPDGGPVAPVPLRLPDPVPVARVSAARGSRIAPERRRTLRTVGVTLLAIVLLLAFGGPGSERIKAALGIGGRGETDSYKFLAANPVSGKPVTWSSCDPIVYEVNPQGAPPDWRQLVRQATEAVTEASGLRFQLRGTTSDRDIHRTSPSGVPPVLIEWADDEEQPTLAGDTVGFAGPATGSDGLYVTGSVVLESAEFADMGRHGETAQARAVIMHELGHLVGLDHVDDKLQLMYRTTTFQTTFGTGDREGLRRLGEGRCD